MGHPHPLTHIRREINDHKQAGQAHSFIGEVTTFNGSLGDNVYYKAMDTFNSPTLVYRTLSVNL